MRKCILLLLLVFLLPMSSVGAFEPAEQVPYSIEFENGNIFVMTQERMADEDYIRSSTGLAYTKPGLYNNDGSVNPIWTFEFYAYEHELFYLDDAVHFVWLRSHPEGKDADQIGLEFYKDGILIKSYKVGELIDDFSKTNPLGTTYTWAYEASLVDGELHLVTFDDNTFIFTIESGEIQSEHRASENENMLDIPNSKSKENPTLIIGIILIGIILCAIGVLIGYKVLKRRN